MTGAEQLAALARRNSEKDLDRRRAPGEWSIRTILHHLAEIEAILQR